MFNELPPERRAFCLTRMIYRDTEELEARHVDQGAMDMAFYGTMHGVVRRGLGSVLRYYALVDGLADEAGMFAAAGKMAASGELEEFRTYVMSYAFLASQLCSWDAPELLELDSRPQDLSAYILGGAFAEGCLEGTVLSDEAMRRINKDVHSRVYTLLRAGYLDG